jgi:hypothetical protein
MNQPDRVIIHHSKTRDSGTVSWGAIRRYHTVDLGWSDIGYHAGIEYARDAYECMVGRPFTRNGGHTRGHNNNTLGFCFVGDYDIDYPSDEMLEIACQRVLVPWMWQFGLTPRDLWAHRDFAQKSCPGDRFEMDRLKRIAGEVERAARQGT